MASAPTTLVGCLAFTRTGAPNTTQIGFRMKTTSSDLSVVGCKTQNCAVGPYLGNTTAAANQMYVDIDNCRGTQVVPWAAAVNIDPFAGGLIRVPGVTGNTTVGNPKNSAGNDAGSGCMYSDQQITYEFIGDAVGGHTFTWGTQFALASASPTLGVNQQFRIGFALDLDNASWREISRTLF